MSHRCKLDIGHFFLIHPIEEGQGFRDCWVTWSGPLVAEWSCSSRKESSRNVGTPHLTLSLVLGVPKTVPLGSNVVLAPLDHGRSPVETSLGCCVFLRTGSTMRYGERNNVQ